MKQRYLYLGGLIEVGKALYRTDPVINSRLQSLANQLEVVRRAARPFMELRDLLRVIDPRLDVWLTDKGGAGFMFFCKPVEEVIDKYLGPIHRQFDVVWEMKVDPSAEGDFTFTSKGGDIQVVVYSYATKGCKFKVVGSKPRDPELIYEMDCDGDEEAA